MGYTTLLLGALTVTALICPALAGADAQAGKSMHCRLAVRIAPDSHRLEAEAWIQHPPSSRFYLHEGLTVQRVATDGKEVSFRREGTRGQLPYVPAGTEVVVAAADCQELYVQYTGEIPDTLFGCNLITPSLVELSLFAGWYPTWAGLVDFSFALQTDLPGGYVATTNGRCKSTRTRAGRSLSEWESYAPGFDLVLVASPELRRLEGKGEGTRVQVYYSRLPEAFAQSRITHLAKAVGRLSALYGPPKVTGVLHLVYSPREGQGYMRPPLLVISEQRAQGDLGGEFGEARRFRDESHEIAHFWWTLADPGTPDDWINEGLAEYTAFRLSEEQYGRAFAESRLREYQQHADASQTTDAIAETQGSSPDREVNRYDKATLMFLEARERFGEGPLDATLRAVYARFGRTHNATTAAFLAEVRTHLGTDAEVFFRAALFHRGTAARSSG
jgi:hypothetical protein